MPFRNLLGLPILLVLAPLPARAEEPGVYAGQSLSAWITRLGDADAALRAEAAEVLAHAGAPALAVVQEALKDKSPERRQAAALTLARMGAAALPALPALLTALKDREFQVRSEAAQAIGEIVRKAGP
jgi:HEAT repeat protein